MDVNSTKFHAFDGPRDWLQVTSRPESIDVRWNPDRQDVSLMPELFLFPTPTGEPNLTVADRRGAAIDCFGNIYWIAPDAKGICVRPSHLDNSGQYWSLSDFDGECGQTERPAFIGCSDSGPPDFDPVPATGPRPTRLRGLAITEDQHLVVGTLEPAGLIVFDLFAGAPEVTWLAWPAGSDFMPFDIGRRVGGGVWVLDRDPATDARPAILWQLDRGLRVVGPAASPTTGPPPAFVSVDGSATRRGPVYAPAPIPLGAGSPGELTDATAVLALLDRSVLVLDSPNGAPSSTVWLYRDGVLAGSAALEDTLSDQHVEVRGHDFAFLAATSTEAGTLKGHLYVADEHGNQSYVFTLIATADGLSVALDEDYLPMRRYGGRALVEHDGRVYYDLETRGASVGCASTSWHPLAPKQRPRFAPVGKIGGIVLDGKKPGCVWHRILFDACVPDSTELRVRSRAADSREALAAAGWRDEPAPYLRGEGSEIPLHDSFADQERPRPGSGTWELLFQAAVGRFVELSVELRGNRRASPRIRSMRVYYPRFSYLREYLPAVYEDDADSASFLDRYLANPEGILSQLEGRIQEAQALFDTRTAPPEYLEWLAGWFGLVFDADWSDARRRVFLDHAPLLYGWRGTAIGVRAAVRIATEPCPDASIFAELENGVEDPATAFGINAVRVVEHFTQRSQPGVTVGDPTDIPAPQTTQSDESWRPEQGSEPLHARYRTFLLEAYGEAKDENEAIEALGKAWSRPLPDSLSEIVLPPLVPEDEVEAADWLRFTRQSIGFTYADARSDDRPRYQEFLARRYRTVTALNQAHGLTGARARTAFAEVPLPPKLPEGGAELSDWIAFVSQILPIERSAHRFSVLVPTEPGEDTASRDRRLGQVATIVAREKPANTAFDVNLYWALFRVGAARLGWDTALGEGSRFVMMVLGRGYLGSSYFEPTEPWSVTTRTVLGRDRQTTFRGSPNKGKTDE